MAEQAMAHGNEEHTKGAVDASTVLDAAALEQEAARRLLEAGLAALRGQVSLFVFDGFFGTLKAVRLSMAEGAPATLVLAADTAFNRDFVNDHYVTLWSETVSKLAGRPVAVSVTVQGEAAPAPTAKAKAKAKAPKTKGATSPSGKGPSAPRQSAKKSRAQAAAPVAPVAAPAPVVPLHSEAAQPAPRAFRGAESMPSGFSAPRARGKGALKRDYTFDSFVLGSSNRMAYAACTAVSENLGAQYSPLFLFGGVGLGKTHLLHAIGNAVKARDPEQRVVYMSAEQWVNEYIREIRDRRFDNFRRRYRDGVDVLLIDDIQFLGGKESSQDEFFHTFNTLHEAGKQIVVTADKYPHEIAGLEERLKTRLSWGLVADVQMPDLETRVAILHNKAEQMGIPLMDDVAYYLATQVTTSVRELEGALHRLNACARFSGGQIDVETAREQLRPMLRQSQTALSSERIIDVVARYFDLKSDDLTGKSRQRQVAQARHIAMALCREHLQLSLPEIGRAFGGRDHTSVLYSVRKVAGLRATSATTQQLIARLEDALRGQ